MRIIGVDFSGARADRNTWVAEGELNGNVLTIENCRPITRVDLTNELAGLSEPTVAAMDFPFSVPVEFAHHWQPNAQAMPDLWRVAADMDIAGFTNMRDGFMEGREMEPRRPCDPPESFSPLHKVRPNLVPMTFRGMQMLHTLSDLLAPGVVWVPPLMEPPGYSITLLEVMPGATLRSFGLPHTGYKDTPRLTPEQ